MQDVDYLFERKNEITLLVFVILLNILPK